MTHWTSSVNRQWHICYYAQKAGAISSYIFCLVSFYTVTAISVDRLLALLLYRAKIQTSGNLEKNTYKFDCFLAIVACFFVNFLSNSSNVVASKGRWWSMPSHLNILLHKNCLHPASQPNTCSEPRFSRTTEPKNSTE